MDLPSSSPVSLRRVSAGTHIRRASPSVPAWNRVDDDIDYFDNIDDESLDELAERIPCSQSPYFTQPTQIVTQPTQIVSRTTLKPAPPTVLSSSPRSVVEVPASSPFQQPARRTSTFTGSRPIASGKFASLIAPAGTSYRAPMAPPNSKPRPQAKPEQQQPARKRNFSKISSDDELDEPSEVIRIEDSSDDEKPARGDIRPSSFKRADPKPAPLPTKTADAAARDKENAQPKSATSSHKVLSDRKLAGLVARVIERLRKAGGHIPTNQACRDALEAHHYSIKDAYNELLDHEPEEKPVAKAKDAKSLIRSFAHQSSASASRQSSPESEESEDSSPKPKKRRLIRGRRDAALSSSQVQPEPVAEKKAAVKKVALIDLLSDGEDEDYSQEDHGAQSEAEVDDGDDAEVEERVLNYLNTCTVDDLVAMLGARAKGKAETVLSHRPFKTRGAVTRVKKQAAKGARGRANANIGEDIFSAVEEYVVALRAIDVIVARCEDEGSRIKSIVERWNVDFKGEDVKEPTPARQPLTPSSSNEAEKPARIPLPIAEEPELMRGYCTMKSYQLYGLNWLWQLYEHDFGCILADDMGLGKTCQVVSFLSHLVASYENYSSEDDEDDVEEDGGNRPWPNLVVVPPSTLANWKAEFEKFAPALKITTYSGSGSQRDAIYTQIRENPAKHHVVLTSYSQLSSKEDYDAMRRISPNVAIFDEGHKMKNCNTAVYKNLSKISANWRLILTGTPVQNNLMEMINLLNFIQPDLFKHHLEQLRALFSQKYSLQDVSNGALLFSDRVRRARSILEPFILQRRKEQVLSNLPPKTSRVVYCEQDDAQRPIYKAYERRFKEGKEPKQLRDLPRSAATRVGNDQNNIWIQLRKSAIHAQLFRRYFDDDKVQKMAETLMAKVPQSELRQPNIKHLIDELKDCSDFDLHTWCRDYHCIRKFDVPDGSWLESGKVKELLKLIEQFRENGDRVLIFTRFAKVLNILRECLSFSGIEYVALEGSTRVDERQEIINAYNSNPDITAFLLTTAAGGTGINLTAANKVVIFDQSDNPQDDIQAENRAHRLGQTRDVEAVKLITRDTIEELVHRACEKKLELAQRVTGWADEDGEKVAKEVEDEVRKMLLEQDQDNSTPPKSEDGGPGDGAGDDE